MSEKKKKGKRTGKKTALKVLGAVLAVIVVFVAVYASLMAWTPETMLYSGETNAYITTDTALISAHRSGGGIMPENTMLAFKSCMESEDFNTDIFEFDLHITKDNKLILLHDDTLDRTTNAVEHFGYEDVKPIDHTYAELRELNFGENFQAADGSYPYRGLRGDKIPDDLRAVLLESCPALEAAVDLSDRRWLELLAGFGGAWGIARSGAGGPRAEAAGEAAAASTAPPPALVEAENRQVRFLAARISEALDEAGALEAETAALLEGDETYACLLTVPGIGPRTAAQLAVSVDIGRFPDHDHLASYCGIAPRVRSSGTSVRSVRASRRGDARLKSLLIFSCNSLVLALL